MFRTCSTAASLALVILVVLLFFADSQAVADQYIIPNPPEPTRGELLKAATGTTQPDRESLRRKLTSLARQNPLAADDWLPFMREGEHQGLIEALQDRGMGRGFGKSGDWQKEMPRLLAELSARRLANPPRQLDAILRELERTGTLTDISDLLAWARGASTSWGKWKFYATVQGILARHDAEQVAQVEHLPVHEIAPLLRDLPPAKAGKIAIALLTSPDPHKQYRGTDVDVRLWLAWSAGVVEPKRAFAIFSEYLAHPDPAWRLMAGNGIARLTGQSPPFRLTSQPDQSADARKRWLASLTPRPAEYWQWTDPLLTPVIQTFPGNRRDLLWLNHDGSISRRQEDVWPGVQRVLPDGTFLSRHGGSSLAMTSPEGEVLVRYADVSYSGVPADHGGLWALTNDTRVATEFSSGGETLWACPTSRDNASARQVAPAGPGRILLLRYGRVELLNRRGDVLGVVDKGLDDPRYVQVIGPDRLLICCTKDLVVYDLGKGEIERIGPFTSLVEVRFQPKGPWMLFDGGDSSVILYDPAKKTRVAVPTHLRDRQRTRSRFDRQDAGPKQ